MYIINRVLKVLGYRKVFLSTRTLRHTMAHRMIMNGIDVFTIQEMLRHSDLDMCKKYLALW
ncbi:tyrosine-type recombinase/integrase [Paenibacillus illinoisensis]|uniref:tyrosine-type recombinase/integrase n=1 Tax=Paenibacillus illinoisensis TaxID=59845 RepID=UPI003AFA5D24